MEKTKKLTPEERALELMNRFPFIENVSGDEWECKHTQIKCALEIVYEIQYQLNYVSYDNTYRSSYWEKVRQILTDKLL